MSAEVLQEFLVKLGYQVDKASDHKFSQSVAGANKQILKFGAAVAAIGVIAEEAIRAYAGQMEKLHYTTVLTSSSAKGIDALSRSMEQFGVSGESLQGIVSGFASLIATSPGLEQQLQNLGVALDPDKAKEFVSLLKQLDKMPEQMAIQFAQHFGIPLDQFRLMRGHSDEIAAKMDDIGKKDIISPEDAERGRELSNSIRNLKNDFEGFANRLGRAALEGGELAKVVDRVGDVFSGKGSLYDLIFGGLNEMIEEQDMSPEQLAEKRKKGKSIDLEQSKPVTLDERRTHLKNLEQAYNMPAGLLGGVYKTESNEGTNLRSKAGAVGPFQFMPETGKQFGMDTEADLMDFGKSAKGAAEYLTKLHSQFGNWADALAAYNAGGGRISGFIGGKGTALTPETMGYAPKVLKGTALGADELKRSKVYGQTNNININVNGAGDPKKVAMTVNDTLAKTIKPMARSTAMGNS